MPTKTHEWKPGLQVWVAPQCPVEASAGTTEPEDGLPWGLATGPEGRAGGARCLVGSSVDTRDQGCNITKRSILCIRAGGAVICEQDLSPSGRRSTRSPCRVPTVVGDGTLVLKTAQVGPSGNAPEPHNPGSLSPAHYRSSPFSGRGFRPQTAGFRVLRRQAPRGRRSGGGLGPDYGGRVARGTGPTGAGRWGTGRAGRHGQPVRP